MTKTLKIILIIIIVLVLLIVLIRGYFYLKQKYKISRLPDYYQDLAKQCKGKKDCCMKSLEIMAENDYKLIPEGGCPEGFQGNGLECIDSYGWCEPMGE